MNYDQLLDRLRSHEPPLPDLSIDLPSRRSDHGLRTLVWSSSIAAAVLLGLFLAQSPAPSPPVQQAPLVRATPLTLDQKRERIERRSALVHQYRQP